MRQQCPNCQTVVEVPEDAAGQSFTCGNCQQPFTVPDPLQRGSESNFPEAKEASSAGSEGESGDNKDPLLQEGMNALQRVLSGIPIIGRLVEAFEPVRRGLELFSRSLFGTSQQASAPTGTQSSAASLVPGAAMSGAPPLPGARPPVVPGAAMSGAPPLPGAMPPVAPVAAMSSSVPAAGGGGGSGGGGWASVAAGVGGVAMAAAGAAQALQAIVSMAGQFVQAFNPSLMANFNWIVKELTATLGRGLVPIIVVAGDYLRDLADMLLPIMEEIQPVLGEFASALASASTGLVETLLNVLEAFSPLIDVVMVLVEVYVSIQKMVMSLISALAEIVKVILSVFSPVLMLVAALFQVMANYLEDVARVIRAVVYAFSRAFNLGWADSLKDGIKGAVAAIRQMTTYMIQFGLTVWMVIGKMLGLANFGDNLIAGLQGRERQDSTGISAATNGQITGVESIGRTLAAAAFTATSTGYEAQERQDPFEQMIKQLQTLNEGLEGVTLSKVIADGIRQATVETVGGSIVSMSRYTPVGYGFQTILSWMYSPRTQT